MDVPVIVVGAGPSGLVLAAELRLGGVEVIVLDKLAKPSGESRGLGFTARAVELFDQRGLLPGFGENLELAPIGHFGGIPMDYTQLDGAHFGARGIPQAKTEEVLIAWATDLGADIRRGWEVVGVTDDGEGVDVEAETPDGRTTLRARYLVACDGGRSTVRKLVGFDFPGTPSTIEMYLADVSGLDLPARHIGEKVPGGMIMNAPLGDGVERIIAAERGNGPRERTGPPTYEEVAACWERLSGQSIAHGEASWVSSFGDATHQVTEYRKGNVLIAGDAAHTHLPAGGQGLSVSVQDSFNLGWKLAATVRGWAPPGLLDTYHAERHPVGRRLLMATRAQGMLYLGGSEIEPLRNVFAELLEFPEAARHLIGMVSGFEVHYDVGSGGHPLLGRRVPKQDLVGTGGKTTTAELLHSGRGVLLDFTDHADLRAVAAPWSDRIDIVTALPHALPETSPLAGVTALLVRPDGYAAWVEPDGGGEALSAALNRWFGAPR
ncbi:FAD-dependent monooxygenase [Streptomyces sp. URMC 129]|uniref:FAD-dependent monooxygenase n=1 Tax=Streptomyces sp. URMC 129 TaxID=3423407 RepID=UPI003F1D0B62